MKRLLPNEPNYAVIANRSQVVESLDLRWLLLAVSQFAQEVESRLRSNTWILLNDFYWPTYLTSWDMTKFLHLVFE